jgi:hypothetical protein
MYPAGNIPAGQTLLRHFATEADPPFHRSSAAEFTQSDA